MWTTYWLRPAEIGLAKMPNRTSPYGTRFKGWFNDMVNGRLEFFYGTTKIGHLNASGFTVTDDSTARMTNGQVTTNGYGAGTIQTADVAAAETVKQHVAMIGTTAAVASNGAGAILPDVQFVAPASIKIVSAWKGNISASDVTKGTATTSASYRRVNLITNTAGTGSGTDIVASLNATASAASLATRAFTSVNSAIPAGAIILASHLTVGAETADGTDMAAGHFFIAYELQ